MLAQMMACCLMAPNHYQNQCWILISEVMWHSPESSFTMSAQTTCCISTMNVKTIPKLSPTPPRGQWVAECLGTPPSATISDKTHHNQYKKWGSKYWFLYQNRARVTKTTSTAFPSKMFLIWNDSPDAGGIYQYGLILILEWISQ